MCEGGAHVVCLKIKVGIIGESDTLQAARFTWVVVCLYLVSCSLCLKFPYLNIFFSFLSISFKNLFLPQPSQVTIKKIYT